MLLKSLSVLSLVPASLVAVLILAPSAQAKPTTESINLTSSTLINLNQISSALTQGNQADNPILHSLSCACSICAGVPTPNLIFSEG